MRTHLPGHPRVLFDLQGPARWHVREVSCELLNLLTTVAGDDFRPSLRDETRSVENAPARNAERAPPCPAPSLAERESPSSESVVND